MKNYYNILDININNSSIENIKRAYKIKISQFNNLPFFTNKMTQDIKDIKEAYYVLKNNKLKQVYDMKRTKDNKITTVNKFSNENKYIDNTKICERMFSLHV
jgi:DnaJ-class molecular chaperone